MMPIPKKDYSQNRFLSTTEAAEMLEVCPQTIRNYVRDGRLQATKLPDNGSEKGQFRIRRVDVEKLLGAQCWAVYSYGQEVYANILGGQFWMGKNSTRKVQDPDVADALRERAPVSVVPEYGQEGGYLREDGDQDGEADSGSPSLEPRATGDPK
jgi:excisionase family DNA binding protein